MDNNLGFKIKQIRLEHGHTMEEFGKKFNTSKGTVNNWEKGRNKPNKENLKAIADLGNISVDELLYGSKKLINLYKFVHLDIIKPLTFIEKIEYEDSDEYKFEASVELYTSDFGGVRGDVIELKYTTNIQVNIRIPLNSNESYYFSFFGASMIQESPYESIYDYKTYEALQKYMVIQALSSQYLEHVDIKFDDLYELF